MKKKKLKQTKADVLFQHKSVRFVSDKRRSRRF